MNTAALWRHDLIADVFLFKDLAAGFSSSSQLGKIAQRNPDGKSLANPPKLLFPFLKK